jgi:chromosome segregation ATPase
LAPLFFVQHGKRGFLREISREKGLLVKMLKAGVVACLVGAASASSPVAKVIQLLDELKAKVSADLTVEAKSMEEYTQFCDDEQSTKQYAIKTAKRQIDNFNAVIEDASGQIQDHTADIETVGTEMAAKSQEASAAKKVRDNESADFVAAQKELVDSIDTLGRAIIIIKREMSFIQTGNKKPDFAKQLTGISQALSHVIDAAWLDSGSRRALQTFVEESVESEDDLRLKQPQAIVKAYENKSGGIVETLEEMKDKAESALNKLRREETNAKHAFQLLHQSLTDGVAVLQEDLTESQGRKSAAEEVLGKAKSDLQSTEATKAADEEYLKNLVVECQSKAAEWTERQKSGKAELEALDKAHEILSGKFAFAQTAVKSSISERDNGYEKRDKVVEVVKKLAREYHSFALMQLANAAQNDPFVKVRGLIESMIANLMEQAQQEADHESFCKEELAKSAKTRDTKASYVEKYQARVDAAEAGITELKQEIATLHAEISEIDKSNAEATKLRTEEKAEFEKSSKDYKESADAIVQAVQVLKDFYKTDEAALLQQPTFAGAKSDSTHGIIGILETAESDFTKMLAEAEATEAEAKEVYEKLMQENKVSKAAKKQAITGKTSEQKSLEVALMHHNDDLATVNKELDAVMEYLAKLKPQCENKAMTYEERKARREAEIEGLKEALSILAGEDAGAFMQKTMRGQKFLA